MFGQVKRLRMPSPLRLLAGGVVVVVSVLSIVGGVRRFEHLNAEAKARRALDLLHCVQADHEVRSATEIWVLLGPGVPIELAEEIQRAAADQPQANVAKTEEGELSIGLLGQAFECAGPAESGAIAEVLRGAGWHLKHEGGPGLDAG